MSAQRAESFENERNRLLPRMPGSAKAPGRGVLYLRQSGKRCRAYVLEGEAPPAVPLHHSRGGTYFKVWAASPAEAELEIEQAYQRRPELEQ